MSARGRTKPPQPGMEEVWSWFCSLQLEDRARVLSIEDKDGVDLVQRMYKRKVEEGEGLFFDVGEGFADMSDGPLGSSKRKPNHIFTNKDDFCFMKMSCIPHCNYPERLINADRELEQAARLCDTLEYLDTMSVASELLSNAPLLRKLMVRASRGAFLQKPCRVEWVPGSQWVWQAPQWFEQMGFYSLGTYIAQKLEQVLWMRYWEHNKLDPRVEGTSRKFGFPNSNSQALLSKTYLTEFWMGVTPVERLQIVGSLGSVVDTALREHGNSTDPAKETKGTAPTSQVARADGHGRSSAFHLKDVRLLSALLDFSMEAKAIEYLFFKGKEEMDQHRFIEVLYFSPLSTAGTPINLILRRLGFIVQRAYTDKLSMDLILGEESENKSKRKNKKKKRPDRKKILRGKLGQSPAVPLASKKVSPPAATEKKKRKASASKVASSLQSPSGRSMGAAAAVAGAAALAEPLEHARSCPQLAKRPSVDSSDTDQDEAAFADWEKVTRKKQKKKKKKAAKKKKNRRACSLTTAPTVQECAPPPDEDRISADSTDADHRVRSLSNPDTSAQGALAKKRARAAPAMRAVSTISLEEWSSRDYTRKPILSERSTSCSPRKARGDAMLLKRARSASVERGSPTSTRLEERRLCSSGGGDVVRTAVVLADIHSRGREVTSYGVRRSSSSSPKRAPQRCQAKRSATPTMGRASSRPERSSGTCANSPRRGPAGYRQRTTISDTLFSARATMNQRLALQAEACYPGGSYALASLLLDQPLSSSTRTAPPQQPMRPTRPLQPRASAAASPPRVDLFRDGLSPVLYMLQPVSVPLSQRLSSDISAYVGEVRQFVAGQHQKLADRMIQRIKCSVGRLWPQSSIKIYGSYATGLSIPKSDLDLVVTIHPTGGHIGGSPVHLLAAELSRQQWIKTLQPIYNAKVPVIKVESWGEAIPTDITFNVVDNGSGMYRESVGFIHSARSQLNASGHCGARTAEFVMYLKRRLPSLEPLVLVLKQYLYDKGLNSTYTGGLASYSLVLMAASFLFLYDCDGSRSPGHLLIGFLELFGNVFNYQTTGVAVSEALVVHFQRLPNLDRVYGPAELLIMDPLCPSNNIGAGTFQINRVKTAFAAAHQRLTTVDMDSSNCLSAILKTVSPSTVLQQSDGGRLAYKRSGSENVLDIAAAKDFALSPSVSRRYRAVI